MPLTVKKVGDKFRVVEIESGEIAKNAAGTSLDGGGHGSRNAALHQAQAVNISQARARGVRIPKRK